jgi:ribosomal protein S18 acetylase RimI-like enzyme
MKETKASIRLADSKDLPFIQEMVFEAFFWRPEQPRPSLAEFSTNQEFQKLTRNWGRQGDRAFIAEGEHGPVGVVWYRLWTIAEHSYGFVDERTPELGMGVAATWRGQGIGRALLSAALAQASQDGFQAISLSVEPDNFSRQLYESEGFTKVGENGNAWTMVKNLSD